VHIAPFFTCPAKDYSFHRVHQAVTWTVTATAIGFALPQFKWSVDGKELFSSAGAKDETVNFQVPDPGNPRVPNPGSGTMRFDWTYSTKFSRGEFGEGVLVITNDSFDGVYRLDIQVDVSELYDGDAAAIAKVPLEFEALRIVYEPQYYEDAKACEKRFQSAVPKLQKTVDLVLSRPDPAKGRDLADTITAVEAIRSEIERIGEGNPQLGAQAREYAATRLQIDGALLAKPKVGMD
jgi:hypothetical protein